MIELCYFCESNNTLLLKVTMIMTNSNPKNREANSRLKMSNAKGVFKKTLEMSKKCDFVTLCDGATIFKALLLTN